MYFRSNVALSILCLCLLAACSDDDEGVAAPDCVEQWDDAYGKRSVAGETSYLPLLKADAGCAAFHWTLTDAPSENEASVRGLESSARITPLISGDYRFELRQEERATGVEFSLEVLDALARPFHNYNYFPAHTAAVVIEDTLWVAGVYTPQVARFSLTDGRSLEPVLVGQWPTALAHAADQGVMLVTNKASDTLGFIDLSSAQQTDAVWVGDEPSSVVYSASHGLAYVSLAGADSVAVVDVAERRLVKTIEAVFDAQAIALSPDEQTLVVASHRSGQTRMYPYDDRALADEKDIAIIDAEALELTGHILEVASTIRTLQYHNDGRLWVTATSNSTEGSLNDPDALSFRHEVFQLDVEAGTAARGASVDLSRQDTSGGSTATIQGMTACAGSTWVAAEGADQILELNEALEEVRRIEVAGRPRVLACAGDAVLAISSNRMTVTRIVGETVETFELGLTERRDQLLIDGLERFTGQGDGPGDNRSCNDCHVDGLTDRVVWNAGPLESRYLTRPLRWLEGTSLIGWDGYVGSVKITGYVGGSTINHRGNTAEAKAIGAYLASLMPSPPANSLTRRDGSLSPMAQAGKTLFDGDAACSGCHAGQRTTNRQVLADGLTPGKTDIPSLIDVARIGSWYKTGVMERLQDTVIDTSTKFGRTLSEEEVEQVTRYLRELTGRDFFVLNADLGPDAAHFAVDGAIGLTFSFPLFDNEENVRSVRLLNEGGDAVELERVVDGRHLTLTPRSPLEPSTTYRLEVPAGLSADDARVTATEASFELVTAAMSALRLEGEYSMTVWVPFLNFIEGMFDWEILIPQTVKFTAEATAQGATVAIDYGSDMVYDDTFVIDGGTVHTRHLPISVGPAFLNGSPMVAELIDSDADGVADMAEGEIDLTGPGVDLPGIRFKIEKSAPEIVCEPGTEGNNPPTVTEVDGAVEIDWGSEGALAFFVATPGAILPLGPGMVQDGETFWALSAAEFPTVFNGPVTYGVVPEGAVDITADNGGTTGGVALESGRCYRFSAVVNFAYSHTTILWP